MSSYLTRSVIEDEDVLQKLDVMVEASALTSKIVTVLSRNIGA